MKKMGLNVLVVERHLWAETGTDTERDLWEKNNNGKYDEREIQIQTNGL